MPNDNLNRIASHRIPAILMDTTDFDILKAIDALKVPFPRVDKIKDIVGIGGEELEARLGALEMEGYVNTKTEMEMEGNCLPNGISAAGLTTQGKRALSGPRW